MQDDDQDARSLVVGGQLSDTAWRFIRNLGQLRKLIVISDAVAPQDCQSPDIVTLSEREGMRSAGRFLQNAPAGAIWLGPVIGLSAFRFWIDKRLAFPHVPIFAGAIDNRSTAAESRTLYTLMKHRIVEGCFSAVAPRFTENNSAVHLSRIYAAVEASEVAKWIDERLSSRKKSVLWVDTSATRRSPVMRSLVDSVAALEQAGWEINAWCTETDLSIQKSNIVRLPSTPGASSIPLFGFFVIVNVYAVLHRWITGSRPAAVIQTTCGYLLSADICGIQFCNPEWIEIAKRLGRLDLREHIRLLIHRISSLLERWQLRSKNLRLLLPASKGIGEAIEKHHHTQIPQIVLPNDYNDAVFNPKTVSLHRETVRKELDIKPGETVFGFTSYGHYRRKGFWLIVDALKALAKQGVTNIRFMVIGGTDSTIVQLKRVLDEDFREWSNWILFVGHQKQVERYLAAADAFLFPSYFEAAARAEVEAAAMGLPLLLTPHCGTEQFPREEIRGAWLEYDGIDIAKKMLAFAKGEIPTKPISVGGALTPAEYADRLISIYELMLADGGALLATPVPERG
jgi:glycosyltransferase involved in cell wall biosynthesis